LSLTWASNARQGAPVPGVVCERRIGEVGNHVVAREQSIEVPHPDDESEVSAPRGALDARESETARHIEESLAHLHTVRSAVLVRLRFVVGDLGPLDRRA
jgi:hypothetical protein